MSIPCPLVLIIVHLLIKIDLTRSAALYINVVVVTVANPPALKIDCYVFYGVGARCPPCLRQWQRGHHHRVLIVVIVGHQFLSL
jgi:hypothetical protein